MKASFTAILSLGLVLGLGACERHSWDSTKRLFPAQSEQEHTTPHGHDTPAQASQEEATGERETSVVP